MMNNPKTAVLMFSAILGVLLIVAGGAAETLNLQFDSLPTQQGWHFQGSADAVSVDGSRLVINTLGKGTVSAWFHADVVAPDVPFTLSLRARLVASAGDPNGLTFQVRHGLELWEGHLSEERISIASSRRSSVSLDGTAFHDFVIKGVPGAKSDFYVDGRLVNSAEPFVTNVTSGIWGISFGDGHAMPGTNSNCHAEITHLSFSQVPPAAAIHDFVTRFYHECLNRAPDPDGLAGWTTALENGWVTGADLAEGFVMSPEFVSRGTSDEVFLAILYQAFFNRQPDPAGFNGWLSVLRGGTERSAVLDGFIYSDEFAGLCRQYGIMPYFLDPVESFVARFYRECLNREPDRVGLDGWANGLKNGWVTGGDVAESFITSPEYASLGTSDEAFLETLYFAFFNRQPDAAGFSGWLSALRRGMDRLSVLRGFIGSDEFFRLCSEYGIDAVDETKMDDDKDGYSEIQGDCDDANPNVHPGAGEICGDGVDQDCSGSDLPCAAPPEERRCADVSGSWSVTETLRLTCCIDDDCETQTFSDTRTIFMEQDDCRVSYDICLAGYGCYERTGTVGATNIHLSGIFAVLDPSCHETKNNVDMSGTVNSNRMTLQGTGRVSATCSGLNASCTGRSTAEFRRVGAMALQETHPEDESVGTPHAAPEGLHLKVLSAIDH